MLSMKTFGRVAVAGTCLFAFAILSNVQLVGQMHYAKELYKLDEDFGKKHGKSGKVSCAVCHPSKSKKDRNNYGAALTKALGAKKVKDTAKIKAALEKIGKEKSATEGKTFGDLIKAGELPGTKEVAEGPGKKDGPDSPGEDK